MASLELNPDATFHELYRARQACSFALRWLTHPDCRLPEDLRQERTEDLLDAIRVHDLALDALYARENDRPYVGRRREGSRRFRWGARRA